MNWPSQIGAGSTFKKFASTSEDVLHSKGHKVVGPYPPLVHTALGDCIVECIVDTRKQDVPGHTTEITFRWIPQTRRNKRGHRLYR